MKVCSTCLLRRDLTVEQPQMLISYHGCSDCGASEKLSYMLDDILEQRAIIMKYETQKNCLDCRVAVSSVCENCLEKVK